MSASTVESVTDDQLEKERSTLLTSVGMSEQELLERGEAWSLETEEQWQAFSRLQGIRFLLGLDD